MKHILKYIVIPFLALASMACQERYVTYSDAEYVMFADTLATYPVQQDVEYFSIPVVSTVVKDYDRTFGVEVIDKGSNAIERHHYTLKSNTITIKAGENRADVLVHGHYDNISDKDSLGFQLQLVMNDALVMPMYGKQTKAVMMKSCPFNIEDFTGYCILSSMFLYNYSMTGEYQRLIKTEKVDDNTILCKNWIADGYDVLIKFDATDPMKPFVTMPSDQVACDEGSSFGIAYGDNRVLVEHSPLAESVFYPCGKYLYLWAHMYVEDIGVQVGTVGHFYHVMEWVSDEEGKRLEREGL